MTRMVVAREGADNPVNNCVILPGALHCDDEVLPVVWGSKIIGKARGFERNGNEISMEVELLEGIYIDLENEAEAYVYVQPFEAKKNPLVKHAISEVIKGRVREINLQDRL